MRGNKTATASPCFPTCLFEEAKLQTATWRPRWDISINHGAMVNHLTHSATSERGQPNQQTKAPADFFLRVLEHDDKTTEVARNLD